MGSRRLIARLRRRVTLVGSPVAWRRHRRSLRLELGQSQSAGPDDQGARVRRCPRLRGRRLRDAARHRRLGRARGPARATGITEALDRISIVDEDSVVVGRMHRAALRRRRPDVRAAAVDGQRRALRRESVVTPDFLADETGYLLLEDGSVLRTADGGRTWSRRTAVPGTRAVGDTFVPTDIAFTSRPRASPRRPRAACTGRPTARPRGRSCATAGLRSRTSTSSRPRSGTRSEPGTAAHRTAGRPGCRPRSGTLRLSGIRCADAFTCIATTQASR